VKERWCCSVLHGLEDGQSAENTNEERRSRGVRGGSGCDWATGDSSGTRGCAGGRGLADGDRRLGAGNGDRVANSHPNILSTYSDGLLPANGDLDGLLNIRRASHWHGFRDDVLLGDLDRLGVCLGDHGRNAIDDCCLLNYRAGGCLVNLSLSVLGDNRRNVDSGSCGHRLHNFAGRRFCHDEGRAVLCFCHSDRAGNLLGCVLLFQVSGVQMKRKKGQTYDNVTLRRNDVRKLGSDYLCSRLLNNLGAS
jgi:hypothetical protein